jgi:hypothetical protein
LIHPDILAHFATEYLAGEAYGDVILASGGRAVEEGRGGSGSGTAEDFEVGEGDAGEMLLVFGGGDLMHVFLRLFKF